MAYIIDRLTRASSLASMQPVETVGHDTRKRDAIRAARAYAAANPGDWVQVRFAGGAAIVATFEHRNGRTRKV